MLLLVNVNRPADDPVMLATGVVATTVMEGIAGVVAAP